MSTPITDIRCYCIARTMIDMVESKKWLDSIGAKTFAEDLDTQRYRSEDPLSDAEMLVGVAGKRCYSSFEIGLNKNVTKIREDWGVYLDNILKSGHGSVLEHATWTWAIEGCTRVFTAEGNRHRAGVAISEASLRYIRFNENIPYYLPHSIRSEFAEGERKTINDEKARLESKKRLTRGVFNRVFTFVEQQYVELERIWTDELDPASSFAAKKALTSMFRRIVPLGVSVGIIYTWNLRALRHIMTMRCDPSAEEEIAYVMGMIAKEMISQESRLLGDFEQVEGGFWRPKYRKV